MLSVEAKTTFKNYLKTVPSKIGLKSAKNVAYEFTNTKDLAEFLKMIIPIDQAEKDVSLNEYIEAYLKNIGDMVSKIEVCIEGGN